MSQKLNCKLTASVLREAANNLDTYGWIKGSYGGTDGGFCAMGSIGHILSKNGIKDCYDGHPVSLFLSTKFPGIIAKASQAVKPGTLTAKSIIDFNDHIAGSKQVVQKFFRTLARAVEHGGKVS